MYACILETGRGFFEEVYPSSNATAHPATHPSLDSRMDSGRDAQAPDPSWFMQNCGYEPRRTPIYTCWWIKARVRATIPQLLYRAPNSEL